MYSPHTFTTADNGNWTSRTFNGPFPIGTKIILTFSTGGGIKLCDSSNNNLYVPAFSNLYGSGGNSNLWMTVPTGNLVLDITEDINLYGKGTGTNNGNLSANNPLNNLVIESGETVLDKVVVVYPNGYVQEEDGEIFNINFDNGDMEKLSSNFQQGSSGSVTSTDNCLVITVTPASENPDVWHAQVTRTVSFEANATYKLTFKVKSTVAGNLPIWLDNPNNQFSVCGDAVGVELVANGDWVNKEISLTPNATVENGRFVINFGNLQGTIYIDDLKLVKND